MDSQWSKSETRNGIPYYIDHDAECTQWDHPDLVTAVASLSLMDNIQYGAYRTAAKLRRLQKILHMDVVNLITVRMAFELHGFSHHNDTVMDAVQLFNIVHEMYQMTKMRGRSTLHVNRCSDLMLNWLLNLYDVQRTGCIRVLPVKIGISTMCAGRITEKYRYFQELLSDRSGRVSRKMLTEFMHDIRQITDMIGEGTTFGQNVTSSVEDCFQSAIGPTIMQDEFYQWLLCEPQTLVWLPTLHRFSTAETMKHETKCCVCKVYPVVGLRYQCLKCFNYDLCQECFFTGRTSRHHKRTHPIQEYCLSSKTKEDVRAFTKTVRNNLSKKHGRRIKRKYRPIEDGWERDDGSSDLIDPELETHVRLSEMSERLKAVEAAEPVRYDDISMRDSVSQQPSLKSAHQSVVTATTDESRYRERRELEDLIDALEMENDELMDELEKMGLPISDDDRDSTSSESEPRQGPRYRQPQRPDPGTHSRLMDQRNEVFARYEVLEEHNRLLEDRLKQMKVMINQNQLKDVSSSIREKQQEILNRVSAHSSGYQASSSYDQTAERLPPYGQSHPALDTIADQSSKSSGSSRPQPRFIFTRDQTDGKRWPGPTANVPPQYVHHGQSGQVLRFPQHAVDGLGVARTDQTLRNTARSTQEGRLSAADAAGTAGVGHIVRDGNMLSSVLEGPSRSGEIPSGNGGLPQASVHQLSSHSYLSPTTSQQSGNLLINQSTAAGFPSNQSHVTGFLSNQSQPIALPHQSDQLQLQYQQENPSQESASSADQSWLSGLKNFPLQQGKVPIDQSRAFESVLDLRHLLPAMGDQSTVHFPTLAASMAYPTEEAELDDLVQRMTDAFPHHDDLASLGL
ncbi:dystrophin-like [Diadema antillarum]|uniref:dystrophin-like n=1 Tax=Diadema antillarum TaxID=105358 RepID=UPI003A8C63D0